tara:strand:+ start:246 stop:1148 length:903 start_codon:yes stop_codon:yes gene_type:complete
MAQYQRKPDWIRVRAPVTFGYNKTRQLVRSLHLNTVCEEASCPNIGECWDHGHATVMILGSICTRKCTFCGVRSGRPEPIDRGEPERVAQAVAKLQLKHVVITSVDRDDLEDGGAHQFVRCIQQIRETSPKTSIEVLTPDFLRKLGSLEAVVAAKPDVYNHNIETIPRLYREVRRGANYEHSLQLLKQVKQLNPPIYTKSGLMVGLGECFEEVIAVMDDMRNHKIDFLTIGQYLQPTQVHHPVKRFVTPKEFSQYKKIAIKKGFRMVSASPLTRSSYHADEDFRKLKARVNDVKTAVAST